VQVGHFLRHYVEMCLAMCFGLLLSVLLFWAAAQFGYPDLRQQLPELSILLIAFLLALPMAAWMLLRGMEWRPTLEMSGATFGLGIVLSGLAWLGVLPRSSLLQISLCCLACPLCFVVMLLRLDLYTGRKGHHMQAV
jgi:hypothetical protein